MDPMVYDMLRGDAQWTGEQVGWLQDHAALRVGGRAGPISGERSGIVDNRRSMM